MACPHAAHPGAFGRHDVGEAPRQCNGLWHKKKKKNISNSVNTSMQLLNLQVPTDYFTVFPLPPPFETFKNKGPKREFCSDAIDFWFPKEP